MGHSITEIEYIGKYLVEIGRKAIDNPKQNFRHLDLNYDPIHAYSAGHALENHVDLHEFALVFYVSDPSEFSGGDLVYDVGPRVTPTRGTLVIAPSDMRHQVLEVTDGWRCSLTTFLSCTD
jgi:predicted 2-oxoglutarate/Fe(II)-dependent dioxygenase YbiX